MKLFSRNKAALAALDHERRHIQGATIQEYLHDAQTPKAMVAWVSQDLSYKHSLHRFYSSSGWSDFLSEATRELSDILIITPYTESQYARSPVFYRGKRYLLVFGSGSSAVTIRSLEIKHPNIPKSVTTFISDGAIHCLFEPPGEAFEPLSTFLAKAHPATVLYNIMQQWLSLLGALHANGYGHVEIDNIMVKGGRDIWFYPPKYLAEMPIGSREQKNDAGRIFRKIRGTRRGYELLSVIDDGNKVAWDAVMQANEWPLKSPDIPVWENQPLSTYDIAPPVNMRTVNEVYALFRKGHEDKLTPTEQLAEIELIMALASKDLLGLVIPMSALLRRVILSNSEAKRIDEREESTLHSAALRMVFLQNLNLFGSVRRCSGIYLNVNIMINRLRAWREDPNRLLEYPKMYREWSGWAIIKSGDFGGTGDGCQPGMFVAAFRYLNVNEQQIRPWPIRSGIANVQTDRWSILQEEMPLEEPVVHIDTISLHGVELDAADIAHVFYNTPLATAVEFGTTQYEPPWLLVEDVMLIKDFLEGMIMPFVLYEELSVGAFNALLTSRSFLDIYELPEARIRINSRFMLGVPFRQQVKSMNMKHWRLGSLGRLAELVHMAE